MREKEGGRELKVSNKRETDENLNKLRLLATTQSLSISPSRDFLMASESYMSMGQKSKGRVGVKKKFRGEG